MLHKLLGSQTRAKVLTLFLTHPDEQIYIREVARRCGEHPYSVQQELLRLEEIGLLRSRRDRGRRYYGVNPQFSLYMELKRIVLKTAGIGDAIRAELGRMGSIERAFIYGSVAEGKEDALSDIDLMVIGDVKIRALSEVIDRLEQLLGRSINYTVYSPKEYREKMRRGDPFLRAVDEGQKVELLGTGDGV